jgi:hypothetical protein
MKHTSPVQEPVAVFYLLEVARQRGDLPRLAVLRRQLRRLGVEVAYRGRALAQLRRVARASAGGRA